MPLGHPATLLTFAFDADPASCQGPSLSPSLIAGIHVFEGLGRPCDALVAWVDFDLGGSVLPPPLSLHAPSLAVWLLTPAASVRRAKPPARKAGEPSHTA